MFLEETAELCVRCLCGFRLPLDKYTEEHKEAGNLVHVAHLKKSSAFFHVKMHREERTAVMVKQTACLLLRRMTRQRVNLPQMIENDTKTVCLARINQNERNIHMQTRLKKRKRGSSSQFRRKRRAGMWMCLAL